MSYLNILTELFEHDSFVSGLQYAGAARFQAESHSVRASLLQFFQQSSVHEISPGLEPERRCNASLDFFLEQLLGSFPVFGKIGVGKPEPFYSFPCKEFHFG